ncbi:hypothetical protein EBR78_09325 [bacterium]|nr:hypothetical protein [bacterium]
MATPRVIPAMPTAIATMPMAVKPTKTQTPVIAAVAEMCAHLKMQLQLLVLRVPAATPPVTRVTPVAIAITSMAVKPTSIPALQIVDPVGPPVHRRMLAQQRVRLALADTPRATRATLVAMATLPMVVKRIQTPV